MRVLHLTTEFPPIIYGGLGTAVGGMVSASARVGITVGVLLAGHAGRGAYDPSFLSAHGGADRVQAIGKYQGATIFYVPSYIPVETGVSLVRLWKLDIVHLHVFWLWPVAHAIQERTGVPLIYHVHSLDKAEYDLGHGPPECLTQWNIQEDVISAADRVIALTRSESDLVAEYCPATQGANRLWSSNRKASEECGGQARSRPSSDECDRSVGHRIRSKLTDFFIISYRTSFTR